MRKEIILKTLSEAGTPMTLADLSQRTGMDIVQLRVDLYKLAEEGKVEQRRRGNTSVWTIKIGPAPEQRGERAFRKYPQ